MNATKTKQMSPPIVGDDAIDVMEIEITIGDNIWSAEGEKRTGGRTVRFTSNAHCFVVFTNPEFFAKDCIELKPPEAVELPVAHQSGGTSFNVFGARDLGRMHSAGNPPPIT